VAADGLARALRNGRAFDGEEKIDVLVHFGKRFVVALAFGDCPPPAMRSFAPGGIRRGVEGLAGQVGDAG